MSRAIWFVVGIVILALALVIGFGISSAAKGQSNLSKEDVEFFELCGQWKLKQCSVEARSDIDNLQNFYGKITLTDACRRKFNTSDLSETLQSCEDVCNNNCFPILTTDVGVFSEGISRNSAQTQLIVWINNTGSKTVKNVEVKVEDLINNDILTFTTISVIKAKQAYALYPSISCPQASCPLKIRITVDPNNKIEEVDDESSENNNEVTKEWLG